MKYCPISSILALAISLYLSGTSPLAAELAVPKPSDFVIPKFADYPAIEEFLDKPATVDLSSHPDARRSRTRLREGAKQGVNFAGHYSVVLFGCGNECQQALVVNLRTGKVYGVANDKRPLQTSRGMEFKPTSKLLIADPPCPDDYNPCVSLARTSLPVRYYLMENNGLKLIHTTPCRLEEGTPWKQQCGN